MANLRKKLLRARRTGNAVTLRRDVADAAIMPSGAVREGNAAV
jgi:hypothetical protein